MSGIGGVFNVDGAPVDRGLLERMRDIIVHRGPDGSGLWMNGKVGLVHRLLMNTEESVSDKQPMTNGRGLWITADCRIDNREELEETFRSQGLWGEILKCVGFHSVPDSIFILFAYQLWGEECPNHLLGDFSFAIWDERNQNLFCARDPIGIKPFVYHWDGLKFLFGSEMKQIFQDTSIPEDLNLVHLAEVLILSYSNREETPYKTIARLPPAHSLLIQKGRFWVRKYWNWNPDSEPRSKASLEENAEAFRHIFFDSVRARLRAPIGYRAGSLLSGGLDSSSIASVAAHLQRGDSTSNKSDFPVFTLHYTDPRTWRARNNRDSVDESVYWNALIEKYGLQAHRLEIESPEPLEGLEKNLWHQDTPLFFPNYVSFQHLFDVAKDDGVRVLFHGEGGDELFSVGSLCYCLDLKNKGVRKFFKGEYATKKIRDSSLWGLALALCQAFLPPWCKRPYHLIFRKVVPEWIDPNFAKKFNMKARGEKQFQWSPRSTSSSYGILNWLEGEYIPIFLETMDRLAASCPLELRYPFLDLRLLRFVARLPLEQKVRSGVTKVVLRESLKDLLPPLIQNRLGKGDFVSAGWVSLERISYSIRSAFENPHSMLRSMIVPRKLKDYFNDYFFKENFYMTEKGGLCLRFLWCATAVDQWLKYHSRKFQKNKGGTTSETKLGSSINARET